MMKDKVNAIDVVSVNIEYNQKHLQELFTKLERSTLNNSLYEDQFNQLKQSIQLFEDNSNTLQSFVKTNNVEELTVFYYNTYLKDYQTLINALLALQKEAVRDKLKR